MWIIHVTHVMESCPTRSKVTLQRDRYTRCWHVTGLFCRVIGLFWHVIGLFCSFKTSWVQDSKHLKLHDACMNESCDTHMSDTHIHRKSSLYLRCRVSQLSIEIPGATRWNTISPHRGSLWLPILSWLNLKANKDYFSYEHEWQTHEWHTHEWYTHEWHTHEWHTHEWYTHDWHTHEWVMSQSTLSCAQPNYANESCVTYEWVMPHIWMRHKTSHATRMNKSCHICEWVISQNTPHYAQPHYINALCVTYECIVCHIWMHCVSHMNALCVTYEWVMRHIYGWFIS